ncbi:MAG: ATP-binding protein [Deltaproteobacteria bacterium]|nr:ATP-binding protein [Deltaproteobacteria bacterium]
MLKRFILESKILFNRMSLRTRLFLAFVILIVSSASATIFIGITVFTNKVEELAYSKVAVDLKLVEHTYNSIVDKLRLLSRILAEKEGIEEVKEAFANDFVSDIPVDFLIINYRDKNIYFMRRANSDERDISSEVLVPSIIEESSLSSFMEYISSNSGAVSSNIILPSKLSRLLFGFERDLLTVVSGIKNRFGDIFVLGIKINHKSELADRLKLLASNLGNQNYQISIFLGDRRILTTIGPNAVDSKADSVVSSAVLKEKKSFVGRPKVLDTRFFAAYSPLLDYKGEVIGMLGIGTPEEVYGDVRERTSKLFAGLIIAGMLFGFLMTFLFSMWLVKPVERLADAMDRVAQGDFNYKVKIESVNEIVRLSKSFNTMLKAIKERDLKLQEMTEERLSRVEKQVSIGRLAAGVAHEINNPLTAILSLSSLMLKHLPPDDPRAEDLKIIVEETTRCKNIVKSLLDFARERPMEKEIVDLNEVVRNSLNLTEKYESMANIKTSLKLCEHPLYVFVDPKQIQQVIVNLILNAAEACEKNGEITIITEEDSSSGFARIAVIDNGKGIPKEHINRVFEPFFTTKGSGKGTGLGLSVSLGIIRKHDGSIEIESTEGKGTRVTVILPMQEP